MTIPPLKQAKDAAMSTITLDNEGLRHEAASFQSHLKIKLLLYIRLDRYLHFCKPLIHLKPCLLIIPQVSSAQMGRVKPRYMDGNRPNTSQYPMRRS